MLKEWVDLNIKVSPNFPCLHIKCYVRNGPIFNNFDVLLGTNILGKRKPLRLALSFDTNPILSFNPDFDEGSDEYGKSGAFRACSCSPEGSCQPIEMRKASPETLETSKESVVIQHRGILRNHTQRKPQWNQLRFGT